MTRIPKLLFLIFFLFFISTCKKDCEDNDGCQNDGICDSGECICLTGYTGKNCEDEIIPSVVRIATWGIRPYDLKLNGDVWDDVTGGNHLPDLYFILLNQNNEELANTDFSPAYNSESTTILFSVDITDVTQVHKVIFYDQDDIGDDEIVLEHSFIPYVAGEDFPNKIVQEFPSDNIPSTVDGRINLGLDYVFE